MTTVCSICQGVVGSDDEPPIFGDDGRELISHGAHEVCMLAFYGEDFSEIMAGQPT